MTSSPISKKRVRTPKFALVKEVETLLKLATAKNVATLHEALSYTPTQLLFLLDAKLESEASERMGFVADLTASIVGVLSKDGNKQLQEHISNLKHIAQRTDNG